MSLVQSRASKANQDEQQVKCTRIITTSYSQPEQTLGLNCQKQQWEQVLKSRQWNKLKVLQMAQCQINALSIKGLCSNDWPHLQHLNLNNNKIGCRGVALLVKSNMPHLKNITLFGCHIGDQGAKYLVKAKWNKLKSLYLYNNQIKLDGFDSLQAGKWRHAQVIMRQTSMPIGLLMLAPSQIRAYSFVFYNRIYYEAHKIVERRVKK